MKRIIVLLVISLILVFTTSCGRPDVGQSVEKTETEKDTKAQEEAEKKKEEEEKAKKEKEAAEKAEQERLAAEKAEQERLAAEKAEQERLAAEKAEQERLAAEQAAQATRSMPGEDYDYTVYITPTGEKYHSSGCSYLHGNETPISKQEAENQGYGPCSRCHP